MSIAALPPHQPEAAKGYDPKADAEAMDSIPLQDYSSEWSKASTEPPPPAGSDTPGGAPGGTDTPGAGGPEAPPEPAQNAKESAREFIEVYDILQSYGFSFYSQGMDPKPFNLPSYAKDRAIHHLAKGLEKMGSPELPWWVGLLIALAPPAGINFMTAREYRRAQAEKMANEAASNERKANSGQPVHPSSITRPDGTVVQMKPVRTADAGAPPPPAAPAVPRQREPMPMCQQCGVNPVKARTKKYCGQHCAGIASGERNRQRAADKKNQTTTTA